jgi:hypothetical protein
MITRNSGHPVLVQTSRCTAGSGFAGALWSTRTKDCTCQSVDYGKVAIQQIRQGHLCGLKAASTGA